jgi:hypothetical protein
MQYKVSKASIALSEDCAASVFHVSLAVLLVLLNPRLVVKLDCLCSGAAAANASNPPSLAAIAALVVTSAVVLLAAVT